MRVLARRGLQRGHDHVLDPIQQNRRRQARPWLIMQALAPPGDEPGPPPLYSRPIDPQIGSGLLVRPAFRAAQHDLARSARYWAVLARRAHRISWARSASSKTRSAFRRPTGAASSSPASRPAANWRRHLDTDLTATPSACAAAAFDIPLTGSAAERER